jgi:RNA polymerase sigma factor (sigma-70 family)
VQQNLQLYELIAGCCNKQRSSQKALYMQYYNYAMNICSRYCNNNNESEEVVNDGFLKIFAQMQSFAPKNDSYELAFLGWIKRIFVNTAIDNYRKYNKHNQHQEIDDKHSNIEAGETDAQDDLQYKDILVKIQALSPMYKAVFNLYVVDGYKHEEIAGMLNISEGTSKSNLAKAKQKLQKLLMHTQVENYDKRRAI